MTSDISVLVRPLWTRCVAQELKKEGADVEAALAESGLDWRSLNKADGWIPFERHAKLLEIAARELCRKPVQTLKCDSRSPTPAAGPSSHWCP